MSILPGFDPRWTDIPDYINGITRQIWEDRDIHTLHDYYGEALIVRSPASVVKGNAGIIAATEATLAEFPDRQLFGEDVIWSLTGEDSFLSSHRLYCTATHTHPGMYGAPSGRKLAYRILADCWCQENAVKDEWLVRDQGAIVRQMGLDLVEWTRDLIAREGGPEVCVRPYTPANDIAGPYTGAGNDNEWGQRYSDSLGRVLNAEFSVIPQQYDRGVDLGYPGHVQVSGRDAADRFWLGLRAAFPAAEVRIDHVVGLEEPLRPPRAAVRFSLHGAHDGHGMFGAPTGAEVFVMGIAHAEFGPRGIRREWALIDETAIWKQILLTTGQA
ncbi:MAG: ester cyclase [Pseudomonadota bacterium]